MAFGTLLAAASASLYGHGHVGHAVSSQSIIRHDEPLHYAAPLEHYAAPVAHYASAPVAHYAAPVAHYAAAPVAHYAAPAAHYDGHETYVSHPVKITYTIGIVCREFYNQL